MQCETPLAEASIIFAILDADKSDELKIDEFVQLGVDLSGLNAQQDHDQQDSGGSNLASNCLSSRHPLSLQQERHHEAERSCHEVGRRELRREPGLHVELLVSRLKFQVMTMMFDNTKQTIKFNNLCEFACA